MKRWTRRHMLRLVVVTTGLLALGAGIASATIPDSSGVYTACKVNAIGTIRLIDPSLPNTSLMSHCTSLETQLSWNQLGQQGPPGAQGPKGDPGTNGTNGTDGAAGPAGPSDVYTSQPTGADCCPTLSKDYTPLAQLNLPAGRYLLNANTSFQNFDNESAPINAVCNLDAPIGGNVGSAMTSVIGSPYTVGSTSLLGTEAMDVGGTVALKCAATVGLSNQSPSHFVAQFITLSAIRVGAIH
jgi:hypothetical protein